jgi:cytochrome P450
VSRAFARDPLGVLDRLAARGDPLEELWVGGRRVLLVADPAVARDVLVTHNRSFVKQAAIVAVGAGRLPSPWSLILSTDHAEHVHGRRALQPAFARSRLADSVPLVRDAAEQLVAGWRDGEVLDVEAAVRPLAVAVVDRVVFGGRIGGDGGRLAAAAGEFVDAFSLVLSRSRRARELLRVRSGLRFARALEEIDEVLDGVVGAAEPGGDDVPGLLARLRGERRPERLLARTAFGIFLAGVETTTVALSWACALLAAHPEEADRLAEDPGRAEAVFAETLRLYPPSWYIGRLAVEPVGVGGVALEPGAMALVAVYAIHRSERHYPEPLRFDPDRWHPGALGERRAAFAYLPFGGGVRQCIGEQLAWTEGAELLRAAARRAVLEPLAGGLPAASPDASLRPAAGVRLRVRLR